MSLLPTALSEKETAMRVNLSFAYTLMASSKSGSLSLAYAKEWLAAPVTLGQIEFYYDEQRCLSGFATWAYFSDISAREYEANIDVAPPIEDWNDGENLYIIQFISLSGCASKLVSQLKRRFVATHSKASWLRSGQVKSYHLP